MNLRFLNQIPFNHFLKLTKMSSFFRQCLCFMILLHISSTVASITSFRPMLEPINGTDNFRMHGKKGKDWFDERESRHIYCVKKVAGKCEELKSKFCFGATFAYPATSLDLTMAYSQEEAFETLYSYQALRHVPKCWAAIQPFLCSVFLPKCEKINGTDMLYLPSLEMCKITVEPCRILYNTSYFPEFLKCKESRFPSKCNNDVREMKFNLTGKCLKPLVRTDAPANYYKDIDGCGLECKDPFYTDYDHRIIHKLVGWGASICLTFNIFALLTFIVDWHNGNKYPALIIFYINLCFMMSCLGFLSQFLPAGREDIVCRRDNTLKNSEPSGGENLSCIVVFILVYYFLTAAMCWFVIFTYAWHMSFKAIGKIQERIDKKASYFHLIAWSLPLILTITIIALSEIDGNSIVGICFVGYFNHPMRAGFLLGPILCALLLGGYFLGRGLLILIKLKIASKQIISRKASKKIKQSIVRIGICSTFCLIFIVTTFICHFHEFRYKDSLTRKLRNYIICQISSTYNDVDQTCKIETKSVSMLQVQLLCLFGAGIVMASFVFTPSTLEIWGRYFRRKLGKEVEEPLKLQKHKVIAQAFAKRKEFQNQGRLSLSFHNSHTDPVGLKFDMNSAVGSHDFSSTWANNLPRFVNRRYALTGCPTSSSHGGGPRKNSMDSEISFSVRHVSVESRRNSIDSQVSVKIAEMKTKVASRSTRSGKNKSRHRHQRRDFTSKRYSRKESSTSVESQTITSIQKERRSTSNAGLMLQIPTNTRRSGISALDPEQISELIARNKVLLPLMTTSEDENPSMGSFNVQDSKLDVILKQIGLSEHKIIENYQQASIENIEVLEDSSPVKKSNDYGSGKEVALTCGRASKNSVRSVGSKKSGKPGNQRLKRTRKTSRSISKTANPLAIANSSHRLSDKRKEKKKERENLNNLMDSSFTSFNSEHLHPNLLHDSISGVSLANSRNSKRSVDVGIQANAYEIATQTLSSFEFKDKVLKNEENEDIYTENHKLLGGKSGNGKITQTPRRRNTNEMSLTESEKLKLLLLPSK